MHGNCWRFAHDEFNARDGHVWVCFRLSPYSHWHGRLPRWVQILGRWLVYELYRALAFVSILAYGGWSHCVVRDDMPTGYREFTPTAPKRKHWLPPMRYEGEVVER